MEKLRLCRKFSVTFAELYLLSVKKSTFVKLLNTHEGPSNNTEAVAMAYGKVLTVMVN